MKHGVVLSFALAASGIAAAAEPPARAAVPTSATATAAPVPAAPATTPQTPPAPGKPLDLRVGNVRTYMMPRDYEDSVKAPDADENTVVVEAQRELLSMKSLQPILPGILAPWWAIRHPKEAWRILAPDINRSADSKAPTWEDGQKPQYLQP